MVSSTDIPNATLKTRIVEGLRGIPENPITPAVVIRGNRLGIKEITIILNERNKKAINRAISKIANESDKKRLLIRYLVPFKKRIALPVIFT